MKKGSSFAQYFETAYKKHKSHSVIGLYFSYVKVLLVNDPKIVQDMLIRDFDHFPDRATFVSEEKNPLTAHLFALGGQRWRDLRLKLSPTFSASKLKKMFPTIRDCSRVLEQFVEKNAKSGQAEFEFRDLFARYTTNVISSVALGVESDCINDPENVFRKIGRKIFAMSFRRKIVRFLFLFAPKLLIMLNIKLTQVEIEIFFFDIVRQTIDYREKNNIERLDFMQMLIQLKNEGFVLGEMDSKEKSRQDHPQAKKLTSNEIVAQVFLFFVA